MGIGKGVDVALPPGVIVSTAGAGVGSTRLASHFVKLVKSLCDATSNTQRVEGSLQTQGKRAGRTGRMTQTCHEAMMKAVMMMHVT